MAIIDAFTSPKHYVSPNMARWLLAEQKMLLGLAANPGAIDLLKGMRVVRL